MAELKKFEYIIEFEPYYMRNKSVEVCFHSKKVRQLVRCRDCKWYQIDELKKDGTEDRRYKPSVCVLAEQRRDPNHFCADGVKREES